MLEPQRPGAGVHATTARCAHGDRSVFVLLAAVVAVFALDDSRRARAPASASSAQERKCDRVEITLPVHAPHVVHGPSQRASLRLNTVAHRFVDSPFS